jgi:membrane protease YdiL (CAAX protease family)
VVVTMMLRRLFPVLAVALVAGASSWAFSLERAASPWLFAVMGAAELAALALGIGVLRGEAELGEAWTPRWGDLRNGFLAAVFAWAVATFGARALAGTGAFDGQLLRVYLQVGPVGAQPSALFVIGVVVVAALEESVWRWLVPRALEAFVPRRVAWLLAALLFAIAHMPAVNAMSFGGAPNFIVPAAALALGLFLGAFATAVGRVVPGFFAHVLFDLAILGPFALVHLNP